MAAPEHTRTIGRLAGWLRNTKAKVFLGQRLLLRQPIRINLFGDDYSRTTYANFTARHPRFPLVQRKTFGAALRDLDVATTEMFAGSRFELLRRKVRRARKLGYSFACFDPTERILEVMRVNVSCETRQGRAIHRDYLDPAKVAAYSCALGGWYGVFSRDGLLRAYCHLPVVGECCVFSRILGDAESLGDGIMHLLVHDALGEMHRLKARAGQPRWAMYDMFFGGLQGLRDFKHRCGFDPYRVDWNETVHNLGGLLARLPDDPSG